MKAARWTIAGTLSLAVFTVHARFILTHFSSDGYLYDSGWFAWLFASADPWLRNPSSISDLSYYDYHLSPYLFLFGAPLAALGMSGITIFALHQGMLFALFFAAALALAPAASCRGRDRVAGAVCVIAVGALANLLLQAAGYPHFEIALTTLTALAIVASERGWRRTFPACLALLVLVREDGGFYAAFACAACIAIESGLRLRLTPRTRYLVMLGIGCAVVGLLLISLKAWFFPGYETFAKNFSGQSWNHVTAALLAERLGGLLGNPSIAPVLAGCVGLAFLDARYAAGLVLLSPLFTLHLVAIRPEHGRFTLYYGLPWLLPCVIWLAVFARRAASLSAARIETIAVVTLAAAMTAPVQVALGTRGTSWRVVTDAATKPLADITAMQDFIASVVEAAAVGACASTGVAALMPDAFLPAQVVGRRSRIDRCDVVLLLYRDMHYESLRTRLQVEAFVKGAERANIEAWLRRGPEG